MKKIFEINDKLIIDNMMKKAEYGTLALCKNNIPYSLAVNFVHQGEDLYFHGSKNGKKMQILKNNARVSFSIVENFSVIASYFSSNEGLACPATQFFKSIIIDGDVSMVEDKQEKIRALILLMQKLQPEGGYKEFNDTAYDKMIDATAVLKINIRDLKAKFKFGQHLNDERFAMIIKNLESRDNGLDAPTLNMMKELRL